MRGKNLIDGIELVGIVECPPPVGGGGVGVNFTVNLKEYYISFLVDSVKLKAHHQKPNQTISTN